LWFIYIKQNDSFFNFIWIYFPIWIEVILLLFIVIFFIEEILINDLVSINILHFDLIDFLQLLFLLLDQFIPLISELLHDELFFLVPLESSLPSDLLINIILLDFLLTRRQLVPFPHPHKERKVFKEVHSFLLNILYLSTSWESIIRIVLVIFVAISIYPYQFSIKFLIIHSFTEQSVSFDPLQYHLDYKILIWIKLDYCASIFNKHIFNN